MWKRASECTSLAAWPMARSLTPRASNEQPLPSLLTTSFSCRLPAKARPPQLRPVPYTQLHFVFLDEGLFSIVLMLSKSFTACPLSLRSDLYPFHWKLNTNFRYKHESQIGIHRISNRYSYSYNFIDYLYFIISIAFWLICIMVIHHTRDLKSSWNKFHYSFSLLDQYHFSSDTTLNCDLSSISYVVPIKHDDSYFCPCTWMCFNFI